MITLIERKNAAGTEDEYFSVEGHTILRESGMTPNGNQIGMRWVLRGKGGTFIDCDQFRHDVIERNGFSSPITLDVYLAMEFA